MARRTAARRSSARPEELGPFRTPGELAVALLDLCRAARGKPLIHVAPTDRRAGELMAILAALDPTEQERLCEAIDATLARQRRELAESTEKGLDFIPRLLRGPVKKAIFG